MPMLWVQFARRRRRAPRPSLAVLSILLAAGPALPAAAQPGSLVDGTLVGWGFNGNGEIDVPAGTFTAVAAGNLHSLGLRADGTLARWGYGGFNLTNVPAGTFRDVTAGRAHALGLRADGTLAGWGYGGDGVTTVPSGSFTVLASGGEHGLAIRPDGTLAAWGYNGSGQTNAPAGAYTAIAGGGAHSLAIRPNGTLAAWGWNANGQSNVPPGTYTAIAGGLYHSLAIRTDGTLAGWGDNSSGQINAQTGLFADIAANELWSLGLRPDGTLLAWGSSLNGVTSVPAGVFTAIAAGNAHGLAIRGLTEYREDLLVSGTGARGNLNRSITVAGDAHVHSPMSLYNTPTMNVAGKLSFASAGRASGAGTIGANGVEVLAGANASLAGGVIVNSAGPLTGSGNLTISQARLTAALDNARTFTGNLTVDGGSIAFTGSGVVSPSRLTTGKAGEVRLGAGQRMVIDDRSVNDAFIQVMGNPFAAGGNGELETRGEFTNERAGSIAARAATLRFTGGLTNAGGIAITGHGDTDVHGAVNNNRGTITVTGGAAATFHGPVTQNGTLTVSKVGSTTSIAVFLGAFSGEGGATGGGDVFIEGALRPGNSPAAVRFGGNLHLGPASATQIEIAGTTAGTQHDQLIVDQTASLAGALNVSLLDGFSPAPLDSFTALTAAGRQGRFNTHAGLDIPGPLVLAPVYSATSLTLIAALPGDANLDGKVSFADFQRLELGFGNSDASWPRGDFDHDGTVSYADFQILRQNFGVTSAAQAAALDAFAAAHNVPEPGGVALVALALSAAGVRRRRHGRD